MSQTGENEQVLRKMVDMISLINQRSRKWYVWETIHRKQTYGGVLFLRVKSLIKLGNKKAYLFLTSLRLFI